MGAEAIKQFRRQKDLFMESNPNSPLTDEQKAEFNGLRYFDYDPGLVFTLMPQLEDGSSRTMQILTTTNEIRNYRMYGTVKFEVDGESCQLAIFQPEDEHFFLPFTDISPETYGAGRYLDLQQNEDGSFTIDFNLAYNPFCAYNANYSCPITPAENRLKVAILAGEKIPQGDWIAE